MRFEAGITGMIFCSVATATNFSFTAYGSGAGESARLRLAALSFCPDIAAGANWSSGDRAARSGHEHEGFNMLGAELTELARCIRDKRTYPIGIDDILHGMAVFDAAVASAKTGGIVEVVA
jgi:predicted dehydrogenase